MQTRESKLDKLSAMVEYRDTEIEKLSAQVQTIITLRDSIKNENLFFSPIKKRDLYTELLEVIADIRKKDGFEKSKN